MKTESLTLDWRVLVNGFVALIAGLAAALAGLVTLFFAGTLLSWCFQALGYPFLRSPWG